MASTEVDDPESLKALAVFLLRHHSSDLRSIILARDSLLHYPLHIQYPYSHLINTLTNTHKISLLSLSLSHFLFLITSLFSFRFAELMNDDPPRAHLLFSQPLQYLRLFDSAAFLAQVNPLSSFLSPSLFI